MEHGRRARVRPVHCFYVGTGPGRMAGGAVHARPRRRRADLAADRGTRRGRRLSHAVSRRPETCILILAFLGGLLLVYLTLPLAYLFFQIDWHEMNTIFADPRTGRAVKVSLVTSVVATAIMTTLGVPLGYLLARVPFRGRRFVLGLVFVQMMLPPLVGGILLLVLYGPYGAIGLLSEKFGVGLVNSFAGIVLAQVFVASPYIVIASLSACGAVGVTLEHPAGSLGASRSR